VSERARRGLIFIGLLLTPFVVGLLFTYELIKIRFPTDMEFSPAINYQEGPRFGPPENAVAIQGQSIILDAPLTNPIPSDDTSLQRGEILYSIHCALCHGETGLGDGPLAEYFTERPPSDLTAPNVSAQFDSTLFLTLSRGLGQMPPLLENLTARERWDVINYIRNLEQ
jgi:mono/diheme cytochrome c family protein